MRKLPDSLILKFKGNNNEAFQKQYEEYWQRKQQKNQLLANRRGNITRLPQDHMPCVVPKINDLAKMINPWSGVTVPYRPQYHPIPNPSLTLQSFHFEFNALDGFKGVISNIKVESF